MNKSRLLLTEQPLVINVELAKIIGLNEAIVLQQIEYWININEKSKNPKAFNDGFYWTFSSTKEWNNQFPFWSHDTVKRSLKKLRDKNILITSNFNREKYDRTLWYRIDYKNLNKIENDYYSISAKCTNEANSQTEELKPCKPLEKAISAKCPNGKEQNALMEKGKMHQPIQENYKENYKENISSSSKDHIDLSLENYFEENICKLRKTTKEKFDNVVKTIAPELIKAIIDYGAETNATSYSWFEKVVNEKRKDGISTKEEFELSIKNFRENKAVRKSTNKNKKNSNEKDSFNNFEHREYNFDELERDLLGWSDNEQ